MSASSDRFDWIVGDVHFSRCIDDAVGPAEPQSAVLFQTARVNGAVFAKNQRMMMTAWNVLDLGGRTAGGKGGTKSEKTKIPTICENRFGFVNWASFLGVNKTESRIALSSLAESNLRVRSGNRDKGAPKGDSFRFASLAHDFISGTLFFSMADHVNVIAEQQV